MIFIKRTISFFTFMFIASASVPASDTGLTVEQKIGQLLVVGIPEAQMNPRLISHLSAIKPGGIVLYKRNIQTNQQLINLNKSLHQINSSYTTHPLLLMTDQEGGIVSRIKFKKAPIPSASELGVLDNLDITTSVGRFTGELLSTLGFNMNLAPVVDLSSSLDTFIGTRSFGGNPVGVYQHADAFSRGMSKYGVLSTLKHFPGHGNTKVDSHTHMPVKDQTIKQLMQTDLSPYAAAAKSDLPYVVMTSHISLSKVDHQGLPATFSKSIISDLLVNKLDFKGLIITDDLLMLGSSIEAVGKKAELALRAGNHLLMIATSPEEQDQAFQHLVNLANRDSGFLKLVNQRYESVVNFKSRHIGQTNFSSIKAQTQIEKVDFIEKQFEVLLKDITLFKNQKQASNNSPAG